MRESGINAVRAELFKALSQSNRLIILELLREGELSVSEIFLEIRQKQSNTSRHLHTLLVAGLVYVRKEGMNSFYGVKYKEVLEILDLATRLSAHEMTGRPRCRQD